MTYRGRTIAVLTVASMLLLQACCGSDKEHSKKRTEFRSDTKSFLMDAESFDLETVTALIKDDKASNPSELEEVINDPGSGINNVDLDDDDQIDYVGVKEVQGGDGHKLDFIAFPSSKDGEDQTTIAQLSFSKDTSTSQVRVSAAYPSYVRGYDSYYYSYHRPYRPGMSVGDAAFMAWLYSTHRPVYSYRPYHSIGYRPRAVYSSSQLSTKRTTYKTKTKVAPVKKTSRPSDYSIKSASKTKSRFATSKSSGSGLSGKKGATQDYKKRSATKEKSKASAFGASSSSSNKAPKKPSSWGSSSGSSSGSKGSKSKSSGSSWGSSSGSKSKSSGGSWGSSSGSKSKSSGSSWGGSSGSRSKSWGGSSSRSSGSRRRR